MFTWIQNKHVRYAALPGLLSLFAYWGMHRGEFNQLDDYAYLLLENRVRYGLTWDNVTWAITAYFMANWHPVTMISYMFDATVFGMEPFGFLLHNYILHICNSILAYVFLFKATRRAEASLLIACLWAIHPLNVECVAWISQRKSLEAMFWGLPACMFYFDWARHGRKRDLFLSYGFLVVSLSAKPMFVVMPFLLTLWDIWPLNRLNLATSSLWEITQKVAKLLAEKWFYFLLIIGNSYLAFASQANDGAVRSLGEISTVSRFSNIFYSYGQYIHDTFLPFWLASFYPYPHEGFNPWVILASTLATVGISSAIFWYARKISAVFVGWFWFFGTLVPVIGLVKLGDMTHADRYMYLPLLGMLCAIVFAFDYIKVSKKVLNIFIAIGVLYVAIFFYFTWRQQTYWTEPGGIYKRTLELTTDNFQTMTNLGSYYVRSGRWTLAEQIFYEAAHHEKGINHISAINLGIIYNSWGECERALYEYDRVIETKPQEPRTYPLAAKAARENGDLQKAAEYYDLAVITFPDQAKHLLTAARMFIEEGLVDYARTYLEEGLLSFPEDTTFMREVGLTYQLQGDTQNAVRWYNRAVQKGPEVIYNHYYLARLYIDLGNNSEAERLLTVEVDLNPYHAESWHLLGMLSLEKGDTREAVGLFEKATESDPTFVESWYQLALAAFNIGRLDKSSEFTQKALALNLLHLNVNLLQAQIYLNNERGEDALVRLNRVANQAANSTVFFEVRGDVHRSLSNTEQARADYKKSLELIDLTRVRLKLIDLDTDSDDPETKSDAREALERLKTEESNNINVWLTATEVELRAGDLDAAKTALITALNIAKATGPEQLADNLQKRLDEEFAVQ